MAFLVSFIVMANIGNANGFVVLIALSVVVARIGAIAVDDKRNTVLVVAMGSSNLHSCWYCTLSKRTNTVK